MNPHSLPLWVGICVCVLGASDRPSFGQLVRGPYLQLGTPTSIVIRWRTADAADSQVTYGTNLASLDCTNTVADPTNEHQIQITGLTPATRYFYTVGSSTNSLAPATNDQYFLTAPTPGTAQRTRIWVIGDAGTGTPDQVAVRDAFYQLTGTNHTDVWLQLGDNAYEDGTDSQYQYAVFDMYASLLRHTVTWPTLGNHDTAQSSVYTNYPFFDIFTLPSAGEAGGVASGTEHYYSFDYANIHFVCLNSMTTDRATNGAMATWLESDLQANTNEWIIAYWHHPPYTKGSHDSDWEDTLAEMRRNLVPILEAYGVDLVLSGHSHSYERSFLINGHYGPSWTLAPEMVRDAGTGREEESGAYAKPLGSRLGNQGAVYAVAGSSGHISGGALNHPAMCVSTNVLGSVLIEICSNRLDAIFLRETGATNDQFTIVKGNFAPIASNLTLVVSADAPAALALAGSDANRDPIRFAITNAPQHGLVSGFNPDTGAFTYSPAHGFAGTDVLAFVVSDPLTSSLPATAFIVVEPQQDTNHNGLPDCWETRYQVTDPDGDRDHDGMTNQQEYWAGTNPNDSRSWLRITSVTGDPVTGFTLNWPSVGGVRYRVLYSDGEGHGGFNSAFVPIVRPVAAEMDPGPVGATSTLSFTDDFSRTGVSPNGRRYYRVQVVR